MRRYPLIPLLVALVVGAPSLLLSAPPAPRLLSPADRSANQPRSLLLSWSAARGAVTYRVQLASNPSFSPLLINDSTVAGTSKQVDSLAYGTSYYWRVSGKDAAGAPGPFSSVWSFTTAAALPAPAPPVLAQPPDGATQVSTSPLLSWNASYGAISYWLQVATSASFSGLVVDDAAIASTSRQLNFLSKDSTYFWHVSARNAAGASPFSSAWSFSTVLDPPSAPQLISPANGAVNQPTVVVLTWGAVGGADSYTVQVSTKQNFSQLIINSPNIRTTSFQAGPLVNDFTYYWRVRATKSGTNGDFSSVFHFTVAPRLPAIPQAPSLLSPSDGAAGQPVTVVLSWNSSSGASSYHVQLSRTADFSALDVDDNLVLGTSRSVGPLEGGTKYYWRVQAANIAGSSSFSAARSFSTALISLVLSVSTTEPVAGRDLKITVAIPSGFTPDPDSLHYRYGGERSYRSVPLAAAGGGSLLEGTVPSTEVGIRGIEYYIRLSDAHRQASYPSVADPAGSPAVVTITQLRYASPLAFEPGKYRMISVPMLLADSGIGSVLGGSYGEYDPRTWRLFRWQDSLYSEYPAVPVQMIPGVAFWLATASGGPFTAADGSSVSTAAAYPVRLEPGWNQMADPFSFPVAWQDILSSNHLDARSLQAPVYWDNTVSDYAYDVSTLQPWEGYFVFNATGRTLTLLIPPREATPPSAAAGSVAPAGQNAPLYRMPANGGWGGPGIRYSLRLSASIASRKLADTYNVVGLREGGDASADTVLEAPPIGDYVSLSILGADRSRYARLLKGTASDGQYWDLALSSTVDAAGAAIRFSALGDPPQGFSVKLIDRDDGVILPVTPDGALVPSVRSGSERSLRLVVGTEDFARRVSDGASLVPIAFGLSQNYPNPFNPTTEIRYRLAHRSSVSLELFNTIGQQVRSLLSRQDQAAGEYAVVWDGDGDGGAPLPSGIYFYRLTAHEALSFTGGTFTQTKKMILLH